MARLSVFIGLFGAMLAALVLWPAPDKIEHAYFDGTPFPRAEKIAHGGGLGV